MNGEDKLFEALTINREISEPTTPLFNGYGIASKFWKWHSPSWPSLSPGNHYDTIYTNSAGELHRLYGPAYISTRYKVEAWYKNGKLHREDGPAYTHRSNMLWFYEGELHREGGPAVIEYGGPKQYWIHGVNYSPKQYKWEIERRKKKGLLK